MATLPEGKLFPAAERGHTETGSLRHYSTFNFGVYRQDDKKPFGPLYVLNDETLDGGEEARYLVDKDSLVLLLPIEGSLSAGSSDAPCPVVLTGQAQTFFQPAATGFSVRNVDADAPVNFLQCWIHSPFPEPGLIRISDSNLTENKNRLLSFVSTAPESALPLSVSIGHFDEGSGWVHETAASENGVLLFVIEGAFHVDGSTLQARDALTRWNTNRVELRSLSGGATVLLFEIKLLAPGLPPDESFTFGFD